MREKMRKWNYKRSKRIMDVGGGASRTPLWSLWRCSVPLITIYSYLILFHHISIIFLSFPIILYYYVHKKQVTDQRTDGQADGLTDGWMDGPTDWCMNTPSYKDARTHLTRSYTQHVASSRPKITKQGPHGQCNDGNDASLGNERD